MRNAMMNTGLSWRGAPEWHHPFVVIGPVEKTLRSCDEYCWAQPRYPL